MEGLIFEILRYFPTTFKRLIKRNNYLLIFPVYYIFKVARLRATSEGSQFKLRSVIKALFAL